MDKKKFQELVLRIAKNFKPGQRHKVHSIGRLAWRIAAALTLITGLISFVINGTELFTQKIPSVMASVTKYILLGKTARPFLLRQFIEKDLALSGMCPSKVLVGDFDGDGKSTDLIVEVWVKNEFGDCMDDLPERTIYLFMKDTPSSDLWPKFTLLRLVARSDIGVFSQGTMMPLSFEQKGRFLIGNVYGTDFPAKAIYGYANGQIHRFGIYYPLGSLSEIESVEPISQIGNRLFLHTEDGILSLVITSEGIFEEKILTPKEIVERNSSSLVLEIFSSQPDAGLLKNIQEYVAEDLLAVANMSFDSCGYWAVANGVPIKLEMTSSINPRCIGDLKVYPVTTITPMISCEIIGFKQTQQFPWGYVLDPNVKNSLINCPPIEGSARRPGVTLNVSLEP